MLKHFMSMLAVLLPLFSGTVLTQPHVPVAFRVLDINVNVDWPAASFGEIVEWMREDVGWNVVVRWEELEQIQVSFVSPITLQLKDVSVRVVLNECFAQLSDQLTYHLTKHLLTISTKADFAEDLYTKVYPVGDLLVTSEEEIPETDLRQMTARPARNFSVFPGGDVAQSLDSGEKVREQIEALIKMIEPKSWKENGGDGSIVWIGQYLVVRNIIEVHEAISGKF